MNILILGGGGREHTFAWKISQSPLCEKLFIAPGNAGTASLGENVDLNPNDFESIKELVLAQQIGMVVVGPEEPLVRGVYDFFKADDALSSVKVIGPSAEGAKLEGSKAFAKAFMEEFGIPTAGYREFTEANLDEGLAYITASTPPIVLKADGLAAGKGVLICSSVEEAREEFRAMLSGKFGTAGNTVVVEDFLDGIEFSVFVLTDGQHYKIFPVAKDYKRIGEGDTGLNTGGMGAVSPVSFVDDELMARVEEQIIKPTIQGIRSRKMEYEGFVFLGLIKVGDQPMVIEYNCRMGDPETEVVFPRIKNDLVELLNATAEHRLNEIDIEKDPRAATTVMLVSGGYPGSYEKGKTITGIGDTDNSIIFHAGTKTAGNDVVTNGGRVIAVTAYGATVAEALKVSQKNASIIDFERKYFRKDIGFDV